MLSRRVFRGLDYKWLVVVSITLGMFMSILDSTVVNVAIPTMRRQFAASLDQVQWVVTVYMLTQAVVIPTAPFLSKRFGSKRAYVWTLVAFVAGSLLCGLAWNLPSLVLFRLIQGLGGGVLLPMVMTLLFQTFPVEERGTASAVMNVPLMAAPLLGPVLGGFLVSRFGWPWAFYVNLPLAVVAISIARSVLRDEPPDSNARLDWLGFASVGSGSALFLYGLSAVSVSRGLMGFLCGGAGLLLFASFVAVELHRASRGRPRLLDLSRFRDRTFSLSTLALCLQTVAYFGVLFLVPTYLQSLRGRSAMQSGEIQAAQALATILILTPAGRLADRIGPKPIAMTGLIVLALSYCGLSLLGLSTPYALIAASLFVLGLGIGAVGQVTVSAMSGIPKDAHADVANGSTLISVLRATAAPIGVALFSSLVQSWSRTSAAESQMSAMRSSFVLAGLVVVAALASMAFAPVRSRTARSP